MTGSGTMEYQRRKSSCVVWIETALALLQWVLRVGFGRRDSPQAATVRFGGTARRCGLIGWPGSYGKAESQEASACCINATRQLVSTLTICSSGLTQRIRRTVLQKADQVASRAIEARILGEPNLWTPKCWPFALIAVVTKLLRRITIWTRPRFATFVIAGFGSICLSSMLVLGTPCLAQGTLEVLLSSNQNSGGHNGYLHQFQITVSGSEGSASQVNFSQLVCSDLTLGNTAACPSLSGKLASTGSGGYVNNTVTFNGQTVPADAVFTTDSGCSSLMSWDWASWTSTSGASEVYVLLPIYTTGTASTFYLCVGQSSITTYQGGSVGAAYDSNTCARYHASGSLSLKDSSQYGANLTITTGGTSDFISAVGQIQNGFETTTASASGTAQGTSSCTLTGSPGLTLEAWVDFASNNTTQAGVLALGSSATSGKSIYFGPRNSSVTGNSGCAVQGNTAAAGTLATNAWVLVGCTLTAGASPTTTLYKNGVSVIAATGGANAYSGNGVTTIFGTGAATNTNVTGFLDEAVISNTQRAATWLVQEYNMESAPNTYVTFTAEF